MDKGRSVKINGLFSINDVIKTEVKIRIPPKFVIGFSWELLLFGRSRKRFLNNTKKILIDIQVIKKERGISKNIFNLNIA